MSVFSLCIIAMTAMVGVLWVFCFGLCLCARRADEIAARHFTAFVHAADNAF